MDNQKVDEEAIPGTITLKLIAGSGQGAFSTLVTPDLDIENEDERIIAIVMRGLVAALDTNLAFLYDAGYELLQQELGEPLSDNKKIFDINSWQPDKTDTVH